MADFPTEIDLINRDPNDINTHLRISFEDVLAEPESIRSIDCVWRYSFKCFELWKSLCYKISTLFCGICIAMSWGCTFAQIAFFHVWQFTPYLKVLEINCGPIRKVVKLCLSCCLDPCCESCGMLFNAFRRGKEEGGQYSS